MKSLEKIKEMANLFQCFFNKKLNLDLQCEGLELLAKVILVHWGIFFTL